MITTTAALSRYIQLKLFCSLTYLFNLLSQWVNACVCVCVCLSEFQT